jgi:hypothetical protein
MRRRCGPRRRRKPENSNSGWLIWLTEPYYRQKHLNDPLAARSLIYRLNG